jgi:hypothetical protein
MAAASVAIRNASLPACLMPPLRRTVAVANRSLCGVPIQRSRQDRPVDSALPDPVFGTLDRSLLAAIGGVMSGSLSICLPLHLR